MDFYLDQQSNRNMVIGSIDKVVTKENHTLLNNEIAKKRKKEDRMLAQAKREEREELRKVEVRNKVDMEMSDCDLEISDHSNEKEDFTMRAGTSRSKDDKIVNLLETCDRFGISETAACHINNIFSDTKLNQSQIHKRNVKYRIKNANDYEKDSVTAMGFDEHKDKSKTLAGVGNRGTKRFDFKKEEHCVVVLWPGGEFAGHVVPEGREAKELAAKLNKFLIERPSIKTGDMRALVSDGCEKMLGWRTGVHASLKKLRMKRYQQRLCFSPQ